MRVGRETERVAGGIGGDTLIDDEVLDPGDVGEGGDGGVPEGVGGGEDGESGGEDCVYEDAAVFPFMSALSNPSNETSTKSYRMK